MRKDDFNTPRIAGATTIAGDSYIGIVTHEDLIVEKVENGKCAYISTYEHIRPNIVDFRATRAEIPKKLPNILWTKENFKSSLIQLQQQQHLDGSMGIK